MKLVYLLFPIALIFACNPGASGQNNPRLTSLMNTVNGISKQLPVEKLYLQTDKENYVQGDTIWLKAYLLDADYLIPSMRSGLLYAELDDVDNNCIKRMLLPVINGLSWGNMAIDEKDIPEGSYTLRAYTNWMRNFGENYVFKKNIYVAATGSQSPLVVAGFKQVNNNIRANILLTGQDRQPVRLHDLQVRVLNGKRTLFKTKMSTGVDGRLDLNFNLPNNTPAKNLSIVTKETIKGEETRSLTIPVMLNRPENTDLQFMPEGGYMIGGIAAKIGFKAIGEGGRGIQVNGKIYNSKRQEVASFSSSGKGMGAFELMPQSGEIYSARLTLPGGTTKNYPLPPVDPSGTSLRIRKTGTDTLEVIVAAKTIAPADYYLIGESRGIVCYAAHLMPENGMPVTKIPQNIFPTGIARFILFNNKNQPLNERMIYIDQHDDLLVNVNSNQQTYAPHDSIALSLQVTDKNGKPVRGSFSMAVTDDNQVKPDSLGSNIINNMLFTADLKGTVEDPGYYFESLSPQKEKELDNLLLTQGWVGCNWKLPLNPAVKPLYTAEPAFTINGKVTNIFNKPLSKAGIVLLSKKPTLVKDTVTDKDGRFSFKEIFPVDTALFVIQAKRKSGSNFNMGLEVDEFTPPVFAQFVRKMPWYINTDTLLLQNRDNKLSQRMAEEKILGSGTMLKEVVIKDKKAIKGSKNLNGPGGADFVLDEKDMEKAKKLSLYELLGKKYPNFYKMSEGGIWVYRLRNHVVNFIIDGVFISKVLLPVDLFMENLTAEDIKGIEIMYSTKYALAYDPYFMAKGAGLPDRYIPIYLEITTYSGNGAFMKKVPGMYIYKPIPFSLPKQFYRPKYTAKSTITGTDQRSTIHWEPNIVTDSAGKAAVSFYSADKPARYTIIIQGTDLNGQFGFAWKKILVR
ncbi:hypothetical protein [Mucilaginibacter sp.]|uniref:hypothetical protein n=1 Tax=Mucilaginibacter sp. TaxID=1882438 RepID=UPI0026249211|nr:hypothetical protein [Mucilaginibacter sp.]